MATDPSVICELLPSAEGSVVRIVMEATPGASPIELVRRDGDVFFVAEDSRVIAALIHTNAPLAPISA